MAAKVFKLYIHQETFSENDLVINSKDFPSAKVGDVVEIYQPEEPNRRLLLQVKALKGDSQQKGISVDKTVANVFQLRPFIDVCVNFVNPQDVALDLVELTFKDQYISRSDMWRLKKSLVSTCAYITKKVEFAGIRAQIGECWMRSEKVGSGVITEDTKIVFRSSTSMVYLFIQLSREMWEFDIHGDLYWEKACMFLKELFTRWKENNSNHEVTIVVFSRTFYDADSVDDFPQSMRKCLQVDYKGRICEDFYRVVAQAERMEDWSPMLVSLKRHFIEYPNKTRYCKDEGCPVGHNSTAAQGNFLEAINMSLNVFEKHFIARNFDRTGQITVLITPGAGVFEVDRELTNITKQRMIDNGIGSDLVCLAEQPLHAVPLFKFHNKSAENYLGDDYNIPHWINHSQMRARQHDIRLLRPQEHRERVHRVCAENQDGRDQGLYMRNPTPSTDDALSTMVDYDEYDAQVFKNPARSLGTSFPRTYGKSLMRHSSDDMLEAKAHAQLRGRNRHASDDHRNLTSSVRQIQSSLAIKIPPSLPRKDSMQASSLGSLHNFQVTDHEEETKRFVVGSASPTDRSKLFPASAFPKVPTRKRALINPFAPSRLLVRLTSNRRRWTHTFPLGPTGEAMQHHHHKKSPVPEELAVAMDATSPPSKGMLDANMAAVEARRQAGLVSEESMENLHKSASLSSLGSDQGGGMRRVDSAGSVSSVINTYEMSGVDWKSLTMPACLPITTDYFPEKHSLEYDYLESNYDLLADFEDSMEMKNMEPVSHTRQTLNTQQVFTELISQRLMQGFQLIVLPKDSPLSVPQGHTPLSSSPRFSISRRKHRSEDQPSPTTGLHPSPDRTDSHHHHLSPGAPNVRTQLIKSLPHQGGVVKPPKTSTPLVPSPLRGSHPPPPLTTPPGSPESVFTSPVSSAAVSPTTTTHSSRRLSLANFLTPSPKKSRRFSSPAAPAAVVTPELKKQPPQLSQKSPSPSGSSLGRLSRDSSPSTRSISGVLGGSPTLSRMWISQRRSREEDEYWLSMGRNFHKVVASRSRQSCIIHVTKYKPRHPSHTNPWGYRFRLWPVYQQVYDPARTEFQHDNLENYNWNYLDNYICSSGGDDFDLMDSLKFWRTRFLLLPAMSASTKMLSETPDTTFDVYPDRSQEEQQQMVDGFLRFMEIVNRIRRPASNRKQKKIIQGIAKFMGLLRHVRNHEREERGDSKELSTPTSGGRRPGFNLSAPTTPTAPLSPLPPTEKDQQSQQAKVESFPVPPSTSEVAVAMVMANTENTEDLISDAMATTVTGEGEEAEMEQEGKLTLTSPPEVIIEAMKDTNTGVGFLPDQRGLPANSFISAEAVAWVSEAVDGVVSHLQAVELLQKLVEDHYIVHASLNPGHPFCNGFFLYCILSEENRKRVSEFAGRQYPGSYSYQPDGTSFQSYWVEVSITSVPMATIVPSFLSPRLRSDSKDTVSPDNWSHARGWMGGGKDVRIPGMKGNPPYKCMVLDVDMNKKSDRVEWCTLRYHGNYTPGCSFEFEVQWMVTTPNILYDLLSGWARKAASCGFHLVPVPYDPFALPESSTHDPLRRPQFIPLQLEGCLGEGQTSLFEEFVADTHSERLQLFQEAILKRFGFVRDNSRPGSGSYYLQQTNRLQFVHETGVALVQIPEYRSKPQGLQKFKTPFSHVNASETRAPEVSNNETRTRYPSAQNGNDEEGKVGFYWTYNYVLTKRWRSSSTGEEKFGERLLADLTSFCLDQDWRLRDFWKESQHGPLESALGQ
ncbi:PREDICTED: LOW QUALITY PROTEIN: DEP domain-containing protein 5-like [Branchiostoma belcheri]|uniref:LOW QUALITY PROTEIN: DEP domain-containing protein 5-like n=1 Tax=Branchiostoma belcheri TaxID=7741 RepID=A0A6P4Z541_BRABE|nr:PREDICTED: LOW QUALITY PROTEIN: DEP domain-containing protein 5-like [Branchiostoma belcheri]